jgi:protein-disulfide isomerase
MKRRNSWPPLAVLLFGFLAALPARAQQTQPSDDLKKDIDSLKESVKAIQKDLQDIKALLQARQPAPAQQNVELDLDKLPFKGERTAKLTIVEISDYQ